MRHHAKSFYKAFKNLPKERFLAVSAIYAFCRSIDDVVDEDETTVSLEDLEALVTQNKPLDLPWVYAFLDTRSQFEISDEAFLNQIKGQKMDQSFTEFTNMDELITYCELVAGSVGQMLMPILSDERYEKETIKFERSCINLGVAMQLTNIMRDVGEDLQERNRIYLPLALLEKYELTKEDIKQMKLRGQITDSYKHVMDELMVLSEVYYSQIAHVIRYFHPSCRLSVLMSALLYQAIETEIIESDYNNLSKRNYVSKPKQAKIALRALKMLETIC